MRTLPYLRDWNEKYAANGLTIVGVHAPEFEFEKDEGNVREAMVRERITWPVAMDNDFNTWRAYKNRYWPHKFLMDQNGEARFHHIGEGAYLETELWIRALLEEAGNDISSIPIGGVVVEEGEAPPSGEPRTHEIYAGSAWRGRFDYLGNSEGYGGGAPTAYNDPGDYEDGKFYLQGVWSIDSESVTHSRTGSNFEDYIAIDYSARSVNVVVRPTGGDPFPVIVTLDGEPVPVEHRGKDIAEDGDGNTVLNIDGPRMYNVLQSPMQRRGELRLSTNSPDFSLFTYTFSR